MVTIIDGSRHARQIVARVATEAEAFTQASGIAPGLAVVLVGSDAASEIYVRRKIAKCREAGILSIEHRLPAQVDEATLLSLIVDLNTDEKVHGILVQLPLPPQIDADKVLDCISPTKDVDGFHPVNVGRLSAATPGLVPCTPLGCMRLLDTVISDFRGLHAVVIGKSNIVGKPVALMLLERECTVTVTHIHTVGLPSIARGADILVVAAGKPNLVRGDWVKPGAVVIDVGINRVPDGMGTRIIGDVARDEVTQAAAITPVPGGVGPMTIACLLENTMRAAHMAAHLSHNTV